jgi:hypothetical protein
MNEENINSIQIPNTSRIEPIQPKSEITSVVGDGLNIIIFIITGISVIFIFVSLILGIIFSFINKKVAKYAWISLGISVGIIILCIVGYTVITLTRNFV